LEAVDLQYSRKRVEYAKRGAPTARTQLTVKYSKSAKKHGNFEGPTVITVLDSDYSTSPLGSRCNRWLIIYPLIKCPIQCYKPGTIHF
jgi:hypothetical protein